MSNLPFKITLTKKESEIISGMQNGYYFEHCNGVRFDGWYQLSNHEKSSETIHLNRVSSSTVKNLENKGMIVLDPNHHDWRSSRWILTERGKDYQIKN